MSEHGGSVLAVASVGGLRSGSPIGAYSASKAALIHLVRQLGAELGPTVRVNANAPAVIKTRVGQAALPRPGEGGRSCLPDESAGAAGGHRQGGRLPAVRRRLLVTGETLVVDGGVTVPDS